VVYFLSATSSFLAAISVVGTWRKKLRRINWNIPITDTIYGSNFGGMIPWNSGEDNQVIAINRIADQLMVLAHGLFISCIWFPFFCLHIYEVQKEKDN
jgi:hypothetical protein